MSHFAHGFQDELVKLSGKLDQLRLATKLTPWRLGLIGAGLGAGLGALAYRKSRPKGALVGGGVGGLSGGLIGRYIQKKYRLPIAAYTTAVATKDVGKGLWRYLNKPVTEVAGDIATIPAIGLGADIIAGGVAPIGTALGLAIPAALAYSGYKALRSIGEMGGEGAAQLYQELGGGY